MSRGNSAKVPSNPKTVYSPVGVDCVVLSCGNCAECTKRYGDDMETRCADWYIDGATAFGGEGMHCHGVGRRLHHWQNEVRHHRRPSQSWNTG